MNLLVFSSSIYTLRNNLGLYIELITFLKHIVVVMIFTVYSFFFYLLIHVYDYVSLQMWSPSTKHTPGNRFLVYINNSPSLVIFSTVTLSLYSFNNVSVICNLSFFHINVQEQFLDTVCINNSPSLVLSPWHSSLYNNIILGYRHNKQSNEC